MPTFSSLVFLNPFSNGTLCAEKRKLVIFLHFETYTKSHSAVLNTSLAAPDQTREHLEKSCSQDNKERPLIMIMRMLSIYFSRSTTLEMKSKFSGPKYHKSALYIITSSEQWHIIQKNSNYSVLSKFNIHILLRPI